MIRTLMIDLNAARQRYWEVEHVIASYQDIWHRIRQTLAEHFQYVVQGHELKDDTLTVTVHNVAVAQFEVKAP